MVGTATPVLSAAEELSAAQSGDPEAFGLLYKRYRAFVRNFIRSHYRIGFDHVALDDVVQDTFVNAFRFLSQYRGDSSFSTWLMSIAKRCFWMHLRNQKKQSFVDSELDLNDMVLDEDDDASRPDLKWSEIEVPFFSTEEYDINHAISRLPVRQQRVIAMHIEGYTENEISQTLERSKRSIQRDGNRARTRLTRVLKSAGQGSVSAPVLTMRPRSRRRGI